MKKSADRVAGTGTGDGMWRITALLAKAADVSNAQFAEAMRGRIGAALAAALATVPDLDRVVVSLRPENSDPALVNAFPIRHDALLEIWCASEHAAARAAAAIAASGAVAAAVDGVLDGARGAVWLAEVVPQKPDAEGRTRVKFLAAGEIAEGWTVARAQHYWKEEHPRVARTVPAVWNAMTSYTQFHGRETPPIDLGAHIARTRFVPLCSDMGYLQPGDFLAAYSDPDYLRVIRPDEQKFGRPGDMLAFITDREIELLPRSARA